MWTTSFRVHSSQSYFPRHNLHYKIALVNSTFLLVQLHTCNGNVHLHIVFNDSYEFGNIQSSYTLFGSFQLAPPFLTTVAHFGNSTHTTSATSPRINLQYNTQIERATPDLCRPAEGSPLSSRDCTPPHACTSDAQDLQVVLLVCK